MLSCSLSILSQSWSPGHLPGFQLTAPTWWTGPHYKQISFWCFLWYNAILYRVGQPGVSLWSSNNVLNCSAILLWNSVNFFTRYSWTPSEPASFLLHFCLFTQNILFAYLNVFFCRGFSLVSFVLHNHSISHHIAFQNLLSFFHTWDKYLSSIFHLSPNKIFSSVLSLAFRFSDHIEWFFYSLILRSQF